MNPILKKFLKNIRDKGKKIVKGEFIYYKFENPEEILNTLVFNNFLLHGSSRKIVGKLIPHLANDQSKEFGNQNAIYLTSVPLSAMFSSLTGGVKDIGKTINQKKTSKGVDKKIKYKNTYFAVSCINKIRDKGYVYVFPRSVADSNEHNEFIAKKPIKPELIIEIERKDFPFTIEKIAE